MTLLKEPCSPNDHVLARFSRQEVLQIGLPKVTSHVGVVQLLGDECHDPLHARRLLRISGRKETHRDLSFFLSELHEKCLGPAIFDRHAID